MGRAAAPLFGGLRVAKGGLGWSTWQKFPTFAPARMQVKQLMEIYSRHPVINGWDAIALPELNPLKTRVDHLTGSSASMVIAAAFLKNPQNTFLIIADDFEQAAYLQTDLSNFIESKEILLLPESYRKSFVPGEVDSSNVLKRAEAISRLSKIPRGQVIVTYPQAICEKVIGSQNFSQNTYEVKVGDKFDLDFLMEMLSEHDFERVDFVYEPGQYAIRGGIVDVFSFANDLPYRVELDGDIIESIRLFEPEDQLSVKKVMHTTIVPNIQSEVIAKEKVSFFGYLPDNTIVWTHDLQFAVDIIAEGLVKAEKNIKENKEYDTVAQLYETANEMLGHLEKRMIAEYGTRSYFKPQDTVSFKTSPQPLFHKNFNLLIENLKGNQKAGYENIIFSDNARQIERLHTIFDDLDKEVKFEPVYQGLSEGYLDHDLKIACYTEHQLFDRYYKYKGRRSYSSTKALTLKELRELSPGDYVTHIDHGIGKFAGLEKIEMNGVMSEAVRLVYRDNDLLYVHINSLHKISKYVGKEGTEPKMNKLGSDAWDKLKKSTKKKVKDIARDLIKLYAARKAQPGFAFSPDSYLQVELEASFLYEDTPDQSKATEDVKRDMESPHPMDRLVCGDVGFGKTEVAIRAAFKAVTDGKQVAILVPTTILAYQHYKTFKDRLADFPCTVDYLNRFRSAKEKKEILKKLEDGKIDIIIGTHVLVGKEMKFKDLGLLVIDEEQKFGVAVKEKLKQIRVNVDTLTLTATPIPRTLHFSLMGARDLSVINTPPPNRQPVRTELHVFNQEIIAEAVGAEIQRGGQVFFIHNRVKDIYDYAAMIEKLVPGVKAAVAHGQMEGHQLEDIMIKFVEGEYDVLVATTIIESGLDIPNANTIIINNAHNHGLSDLHQMRGRVGRSNKKAYCYLFSPPLSTLTAEARKRLSAIEQFSDLGSGFNVAMRDLDIRGAGNLLGGEQSGFIAEIGFEMYHKILDEAIQELKDDEFKDLFKDEAPVISNRDVQVDVDAEILIPDNYVRNIQERLSLYNEMAQIGNEDKLLKFRDELIDRFGPLPKQLKGLFDSMRLKWKARDLGFERVALRNNSLTCYFPLNQADRYYQSEMFGNIIKYVSAHPVKCAMKQTPKNLTLILRNITGVLDAIRELDELKVATMSQSANRSGTERPLQTPSFPT